MSQLAEIQALTESIREMRKEHAEAHRQWLEYQEQKEQAEQKRKTEEEKRKAKEEKERAKTDEKFRELSELFTGQWGKLVEALVEPDVTNLFRQRGIGVHHVHQNIETKDERNMTVFETDLLLVNGDEIVAVEVKTTCRPDDIKKHAENLKKIKSYYKEYRNYKVYGAVAALKYLGNSDRMAYQRGMFVLKSTKGIVQILNDENFKPKAF